MDKVKIYKKDKTIEKVEINGVEIKNITKVEIIQVIKIEYEIKDEKCPMPVRTIKEYRTLDDKIIGIDDPLEKYRSFFEAYKYEKI